jgi:hypothetical protein
MRGMRGVAADGSNGSLGVLSGSPPRVMNLVDPLGYLQFDEDGVFDEQVSRIVPDHRPIVSNDHAMLPRDAEPSLAKLVRQSVFIDFLKEPCSQPVEHGQGAANDSFGQGPCPRRYLFACSACFAVPLPFLSAGRRQARDRGLGSVALQLPPPAITERAEATRADRPHQGRCQGWMNFAGCVPALVPRSAVCLTGRKMEPQITQNTQKAAVRYRSRTMRLISRRGLPKLSSRQRCKPVAFR